MKKVLYSIIYAIVAITVFASCDDTETYADQKEAENNAINNYLVKNGINVISESQFHNQGDSTSVERNEYVLFSSKGVYMQIIEKGCGAVLKDGESADVLCRYTEYNINGDSLQLSNIGSYATSMAPDKMTVRNTSGTFTASFSYGVMASSLSSTSVPAGWLVPLTYIKLGRPASADENIAHVKLIVPHDQGHAYASSGVYACHYDITYERGQ